MSRPASETKAPDETGLAAAQAAQKAVAPDIVILFGSRARGDHRPDSDVDLLVICSGCQVTAYGRARRAVKTYFRDNPPALGLDVVTMDRERFHWAKRAKNHVAGQALRDGVVMSREKLDFGNSYQDNYPESWPDVKERLLATYRHLGAFNREINHPDGEQENYGFHAQQAVENSLKAWCSAVGLGYGRIHDIEEIAEKILNDPAESDMPAADQLRALLEYTSFEELRNPGELNNWLTRYAVFYRYGGTEFDMDNTEQDRFQQEITTAVRVFIERAQELTGTDDYDLGLQ